MKLLKRILLAGIALVIVLGLLAYFTIKIAFPPQKIRQLVHDQGMAMLGREVSVGDVSIRILPSLMVTVQDIHLANAPGFSKTAAVQLREIHFSIHWMSLLRLSPDITEIKLVNPEILFEVDKQGRNNFEGLGGSQTAEAAEVDTAPPASKPLELPASLALRSFVINQGRVRYHDLKAGQELILDNINQKVSLELDPTLRNAQTQGRLSIAQVMVQDSASGLRKGDVRISLSHDLRLDLPGEKLRIKSLELGFQDIKVTVSGEVSQFIKGPPRLDVKIAAPRISLASVLKEVPASLSPEIPKLSASGVAALDLVVQGLVDSVQMPDLRGSFTLENGALAHRDVPVGIEGLGLRLDFLGDTLALPLMAMKMGQNPVSMVSRLHGWKTGKVVLEHFTVDAAVDLDPLVSLGQRMGMVDEKMALSGLIKAAIRASGPLDPQTPEAIRASGQVDLIGVQFQTPDMPVMKVDAKTTFDNDRISEDAKVILGKSDIAVKGEARYWQALVLPKQAKGKRAQITAQVRSDYLDLDELKPKTETTSTAEAPPMTSYPALPPLDAALDILLANTRLMGLDMTAFSAKTKVVGSKVTSQIKGQLYTGSFNSGLNVDLKDSTNADIGLKLQVSRVEANDFISRLNDQVPGKSKWVKGLAKLDSAVFGKLNLNLDVQTFGLPQDFAQNLTGAILFLLADGKILETGLTSSFSGALSKVNSSLGFKELVFGQFKADMAADKGRLLIRDAQISKSAVGSIAATGAIGFDNSLDIRLDQALPPGASKTVLGATSSATSALAKMAGVSELGQVGLFPKDAQGRALLYFLVGGNMSRPEFKLDAKRMASEANSGAKAALGAVIDAKKAELKAKLDAEKQKLQTAVKAKTDSVKKEVEAKVEAEKQKATEQVKEKTKGEAKKALKNLGF